MEPQDPCFDEIAAELSPPLLRYLHRQVRDHAVADDLLQETLFRMARGLPGYAGRASLKTWAFAIARRVAADYFRDPEHSLRSVEADAAEQLADTDCPADERLVTDQMNACVRQLIGKLPEAYRTALVLHDIEDYSARQIAQGGGCTVATAKIRIHRARSRLKDALQQECRFYRDADAVFRCERKPQ